MTMIELKIKLLKMEPGSGILESDHISTERVKHGLLSLCCPGLNTLCPSAGWVLAGQPLPLAAGAFGARLSGRRGRNRDGMRGARILRGARLGAGGCRGRQRGRPTPGWLATATRSGLRRTERARSSLREIWEHALVSEATAAVSQTEAQPCSM